MGPEEEVPEMVEVNVGNPEVAHTLGIMVQNLNEEKGRGGELFAKRRKKADKWVVDENQIGLGDHPSQFADEFITQQNTAREQFVQEKEEEFQAQQQVRDEADAQQRAEQQEYQQQQQQIFKQQQASRKQSLSADLPPNYQHCSLKGRPFTPSMDLGIHNVQGIDVWTTKGPKPYGKAGAQIRTATQKLPPKLEPQPEQELPHLEVVQTKDVTDHVQIEQKSSSSTTTATTVETTSSNHVKAGPTEEELAEKKRKEYEEWLRAQEMEAYRLEYDCSVKYEEHQSEKKESKNEEMRMKQELEMQRKAEEERMEQERKRQVEEEQRRLQAERAQQEQAQQMEMQRQQAEFQKQQAEMQRQAEEEKRQMELQQ